MTNTEKPQSSAGLRGAELLAFVGELANADAIERIRACLPDPDGMWDRGTVAFLVQRIDQLTEHIRSTTSADDSAVVVDAANLPDDSIIATRRAAYIKSHPTETSQWRCTNGGYFQDWHLQPALNNGDSTPRGGSST